MTNTLLGVTIAQDSMLILDNGSEMSMKGFGADDEFNEQRNTHFVNWISSLPWRWYLPKDITGKLLLQLRKSA